MRLTRASLANPSAVTIVAAVVVLLGKLDYTVVHQRGSHIRLIHVGGASCDHHLTVPAHKTIAKGTLNDILNKARVCTALSKQDLLSKL